MTIISIRDVVEHCRIYPCDEKVAEVMGCSVTLVEACRPMVYGKTKKTHEVDIDPVTNKYCQALQRYRAEAESIKISTQNLLIRQLQTGHHWLSNERFFDTVSKLKPELGLL